jgi:hypothetical protein
MSIFCTAMFLLGIGTRLMAAQQSSTHTDWIALLGIDAYTTAQKADPDVVAMDKMVVTANKVDEPSKITRELERRFSFGHDPYNIEIRQLAFGGVGRLDIATERANMRDPIEELFVPNKDIAIKLDGGFKLSSNATIHIRHSGLVWKPKENSLWTIYLKPYRGGAQVSARKTF